MKPIKYIFAIFTESCGDYPQTVSSIICRSMRTVCQNTMWFWNFDKNHIKALCLTVLKWPIFGPSTEGGGGGERSNGKDSISGKKFVRLIKSFFLIILRDFFMSGFEQFCGSHIVKPAISWPFRFELFEFWKSNANFENSKIPVRIQHVFYRIMKKIFFGVCHRVVLTSIIRSMTRKDVAFHIVAKHFQTAT